MKSYTSVFSASSRKLQFNFLLAHREDPFSVCSFGVLWDEKCYMVINHSLNEAHSQLSLQLMNFLLNLCAHLLTGQILAQLSGFLTLRETQNGSCRTEMWCIREDHGVPKLYLKLGTYRQCLQALLCV